MAKSDDFVLAGSTDNNPTGSGEHARFGTERNQPEIRIVMQNLPELRGTLEIWRICQKIYLIVRGTCQTSRMIRIVSFDHLICCKIYQLRSPF